MSDIEEQAQARVDKAKWINGEVLKRLKQPLVHGVRGTKPKAAPKA
jgi:hypothetical protein